MRMTVRASVDFPQPDSPTTPRVSPLRTTKEMSSTARTLPTARLSRPPAMAKCVRSPETTYERTAIGLDARNTPAEVASVPQLIDELRRSGLQCEVVFLVAAEDELLRRFAETRRKHPMSRSGVGLPLQVAEHDGSTKPLGQAIDLGMEDLPVGVFLGQEIAFRGPPCEERVDRVPTCRAPLTAIRHAVRDPKEPTGDRTAPAD